MLQEQLHQREADLENMKAEREKLKAEREKLMADLEQEKYKNSKLQEALAKGEEDRKKLSKKIYFFLFNLIQSVFDFTQNVFACALRFYMYTPNLL